MRNKIKLSKEIEKYIEELPYFTVETPKIFPVSEHYLRILLSRLKNKRKIIRLKKGWYTSGKFINEVKIDNEFTLFLEFIATKIYTPSYLSLEYVLYENNILTEIPQNFTLITRNKSKIFSNELRIFVYRHIQEPLFRGFEVIISGEYIIYKAKKAKALFDFLYLRKSRLKSKKELEELRLNLDNFTSGDKKELWKYVLLENSGKMREVYINLFGEENA